MATSFSVQVWSLEWEAHVPFSLGRGIVVERATLADAFAFVEESYSAVFGATPKDASFLEEGLTPAKRRFFERSDRFLFRDGERPIGLLMGQPQDWSTYYWRTVAFLPEYQGRGLLAAALERLDSALASAGVLRVEGDTAPNNYRQLRLLLRLGYCVSGSANSERWGALLRLVKFLSPEGREAFGARFCKDRHLARRVSEDPTQRGGSHEEVRNRDVLSSRGGQS